MAWRSYVSVPAPGDSRTDGTCAPKPQGTHRRCTRLSTCAGMQACTERGCRGVGWWWWWCRRSSDVQRAHSTCGTAALPSSSKTSSASTCCRSWRKPRRYCERPRYTRTGPRTHRRAHTNIPTNAIPRTHRPYKRVYTVHMAEPPVALCSLVCYVGVFVVLFPLLCTTALTRTPCNTSHHIATKHML